jgi:hypothetical protein
MNDLTLPLPRLSPVSGKTIVAKFDGRLGVRSHVIDPASVQVDRRARRAKTDHIDAAVAAVIDGVSAR